MQNKDLNIFVYDCVIVSDGIVKTIKKFFKKVISYFEDVVLIISNAVKGFSIDINSPPDNIKLSLSPILSFRGGI